MARAGTLLFRADRRGGAGRGALGGADGELWLGLHAGGRAGGVPFTTSLIPRDGGYLLPLKLAVRKAAGVALGDRLAVAMTIGSD